MKILVINNSFWNYYNFRMNLLSEIKESGNCEIHLAAPLDKFYKEVDKKFTTHIVNFKSKSVNPILELKLFLDVYFLVKKINPDVILSFTIKPNIYGGIIANYFNIPIINNISGLGTTFIKHDYKTVIVKLLYKLSFSKYSYILFQNKHDFNIFKENNLLNVSQYDVIPGSGINTSKWNNHDCNMNKGKNILFCARLIKDKGINEYLDAAKILKKKYKDVNFNVVGTIASDNRTSISPDYFQKYISSNIINYLGESNNMKKTIVDHDVCVLPSYREGMSRFLLESASMSKPIVTTNVPGCKDIVKDGVNGYLCNPRDSRDLVEKIDKILSISEEERVKFGFEGRELMKNLFEENLVIQNYINILKNIKYSI
jgi:glycosyltransferase involved in cell wall biosynthesis